MPGGNLDVNLETSGSTEITVRNPKTARENKRREKKEKKEKKGLLGKVVGAGADVVSAVGDIFEVDEERGMSSDEKLWKDTVAMQGETVAMIKAHQDTLNETVEGLKRAESAISKLTNNQKMIYEVEKEATKLREDFYKKVEADLGNAKDARAINSFLDYGRTIVWTCLGIFGCAKLSQIAGDVRDIRHGD